MRPMRPPRHPFMRRRPSPRAEVHMRPLYADWMMNGKILFLRSWNRPTQPIAHEHSLMLRARIDPDSPYIMEYNDFAGKMESADNPYHIEYNNLAGKMECCQWDSNPLPRGPSQDEHPFILLFIELFYLLLYLLNSSKQPHISLHIEIRICGRIPYMHYAVPFRTHIEILILKTWLKLKRTMLVGPGKIRMAALKHICNQPFSKQDMHAKSSKMIDWT
jgi:hypothetical protein